MRMLGEGQTVVNAIARGLGRPTARVRRTIALVDRRARHHAAARERRIEQATRQSALEQLTGGASLAVVRASGAARARPRACPRSATVPRLSGTATALSAASVGRWGQKGPVIEALAAVAADASAAGLPRASRAWAMRQAGDVASVLADADALRRDVASVRDVLSTLRLTDGADRVAELSCVGSFLGCVPSPHISAAAASGHASTDLMDSSARSQDTLARLLCRVCLRYACRLHGSCSSDPMSAPPPARPVTLPPVVHQSATSVEAFGWPVGGSAPAQAPLMVAIAPRADDASAAATTPLSQAASSQRRHQEGPTTSSSIEGGSQMDDAAVDFIPCFHVGECTERVCRCARAGTPCAKFCGCSHVRWVAPDQSSATATSATAIDGRVGSGQQSARASQSTHLTPLDIDWFSTVTAPGSRVCRRLVRCDCLAPGRCATDECPCYGQDRECDPDACSTCGAAWPPASGVDDACPPLRGGDRNDSWPSGLLSAVDPVAHGVAGSRRCRNVQVQVGFRVRVVLGRSQAHGLCVFAAERAAAGDYVGEYVGELLPHADAHARGRVYDAIGVSFLYTLTRTLVLDATRVSGCLRYINHKRDVANLKPKLLSVCGYIRVGFFAARDLVPGEELFFNYGYSLDD